MNARERIRTLRCLAADVLESEEAAKRWMRSEIIALNMQRPIDVGKTADGFEMCRRILGRIEHGVYS